MLAKSLFILLILVTLSPQAFAQKETQAFSARNALYLELGGSSGRYAVNYSRIISEKGKLKLNASAGFALWHYTNSFGPNGPKETTWLPAVPIEFSAFWGRSNHHLELGIGVISIWEDISELDLDTFEIT